MSDLATTSTADVPIYHIEAGTNCSSTHVALFNAQYTRALQQLKISYAPIPLYCPTKGDYNLSPITTLPAIKHFNNAPKSQHRQQSRTPGTPPFFYTLQVPITAYNKHIYMYIPLPPPLPFLSLYLEYELILTSMPGHSP
jgi:hypothetical protein